MSFANNLRRLLTDRKMSVAELSQKSGVPIKTIYHWLAGQQPRKMDHLFKICDLLDVSVEELYGRPRRHAPGPSLPQSALQEELRAGLYEIVLRPATPRGTSSE